MGAGRGTERAFEQEVLSDGEGRQPGDGHYFIPGGPYGSSDLPRVWGLPQVESEALPVGTALVGDFRRAVLFDRESTSISIGTVNDDFIRNIVRVLGEQRAGFAVIRPKAFVSVNLAAAA